MEPVTKTARCVLCGDPVPSIDVVYLADIADTFEASLYPCHRDCLRRVAVADYPLDDGDRGPSHFADPS